MEGFEVVQVKDIIRCQANDNFTDVIINEGKKMLICRTLKHFEGLLEDYDFMRVHKSHLINIQFIKKYRRGKGGQVVMSDGSEIDVSPSKKQDFLDRFGS
ncbi:MAG: LytTR family transcriptional regulator [Sporocytophaga sp.]|nr:LytTR family transcriptional regulator [Sporocytophaga sp.]